MFEICYRPSLLEGMGLFHYICLIFAFTVRFCPAPDRKMRRIRDKLTASSIRDEVFVEGNTFHEYSTATNSNILGYTVSNSSTRIEATDCKRKSGTCRFHPEIWLDSSNDFHVSRGSC